MFALKLILKHVQMLNVTPDYIQTVVVSTVGKDARFLASREAVDLVESNSISYLSEDKQLSSTTNVCMGEKSFCTHLDKYVTEKIHFFVSTEAPADRHTRAEPYTIQDDKKDSDKYTSELWAGVERRLPYTDVSSSPCAFSEATCRGYIQCV